MRNFSQESMHNIKRKKMIPMEMEEFQALENNEYYLCNGKKRTKQKQKNKR